MPSSPVSIGKRPDFKQSRSAGWTWPRLVPINEQQSRLSQASQSSASPSLPDHNEQEEQPPTMIATIISKLNGEEAVPPSHVPSAAGGSPTAGGSVAEAADHQPYEHMPGSLLSTLDLTDEGGIAASRENASSSSSSVEDLAGKNFTGSKGGSVQDESEKDSPTPNHGSGQDTAEKDSPTSNYGSVHDAAEKNFPTSNHGSVQDVAEKTYSVSGRESVQDPADKSASVSKDRSVHDIAEKSPGSEHGSVGDVAGKSFQDSRSGSLEDVAEISPSASEHGLVEDTANQDDTEIPAAHEDTTMDVPLKEGKPATPPATPIPPVMDRVSVPLTPVPYPATPKIMVQEPSQSSEEETPFSRTIDEISANERQSPAQETNPQPSQSTPEGTLIDGSPMQSMSLKPIAWQAPKNQKVRKRKLYLRKLRNAAARKTILKVTLGRQLAIPTKQMLRLLADGERLTIPDVSEPGVEAATILVPQDAVGSVTGAVLLPHGIGAAPDE